MHRSIFPASFSLISLLSFLAVVACGPTQTLGEPEVIVDEKLPPIEVFKDGTVSVGTEWFNSVSSFHRSESFSLDGRRCKSENPPDTGLSTFRASDCSFNQSSILPEYQPGAVYEIPVVFHVIQRSDGAGALSPEMIRSQVDVLNEDYLALAGTLGEEGTNATIRFVLASVDPTGNPTNGIEFVNNNSYFKDPGNGVSPMKADLNWDTNRYFNIYTNDASGALGYATFPTESAGDRDDGVVLLWSSVGRDNPLGGEYNLGRTATHEVGHYLGLFHTFQDGCDRANPYSSGDRIADTVNHNGPNASCSQDGPSNCGGGRNPVENYMNYTEDACLTRFTPEQVNRMRCTLINYRQDLYHVVGESNNQFPTSSFEVVSAELEVRLTDTSLDADGTVVAWNWQFGDGSSSSEQNPTHTYAGAGTYSVSLQVTDNENATSTFTSSVTVSTSVPPTSNVLVSAQAVPNLSGIRDGSELYTLEVPEGASRVTFVISSTTEAGDADLYVRLGLAPTLTEWDHRPFLFGSNEAVEILSPAAGTYHVMLRGYTDFSGVELLATIEIATPTSGEGVLLINEIMADPGRFDSNQDGTVSFSDDEFIELLNVGDGDLNLSGATISDAVGVRFTFPNNTIVKAGAAVVVFGYVDTDFFQVPGVQVFGSRLQLNNNADVLTIASADGTILSMVSYGRKAGNNQSIVRGVDGTDSEFVQHRSISSQAGSPGTRSDGSPF